MGVGGWLLERLWRLPPATTRVARVERDIPVPADDGTLLLTDVFVPEGGERAPTLLQRTPYGRRTLGELSAMIYTRRGFRVVVQSCRGTFGSGGTFRPQFHERADGLATLRWLEAQPWFDGRLAMTGPSYLGYAQWALASEAGPSLRAICPHITMSNLPEHWYRGGSFSLDDAIGWTAMVETQERGATPLLSGLAMLAMRRRVRRSLDHLPLETLDERVLGRRVPFWRDFVTHTEPRSAFWEPANHSARVADVRIPVTMVTGWHDIFLPVQLADYSRLVAAGNPPRLVIGPWTHVAPAGMGAQARETLAALRAHLLGDAAARPAAPVRVFVQGAKEWRDLASWPPPGHSPQRWHLHADARLATEAPAAGVPRRYRYDPADPTPIAGGSLLSGGGGPKPQRHTEARRDVLLYTSEPVARDVNVIGPVEAEICVSSSSAHFDVFVRLCVVDAKGRSTNVCDGLERVAPDRWPAGVDGLHRVRVALWPTAQRFRAGERIRIQVSSGAHPRYARNLGSGEPLGTGITLRASEQAVHHEPGRESVVWLPVVRPVR